MSTQQAKPKVEIVKFNSLTLRKEYNDEANDYALLTWSSRNGYPRVTVFTSNANRGENFDYNTMVISPLDYVTLDLFLTNAQKVIEGDPDTKETIDCYNIKYVNNERTNDTYVQSSLTVGKDAEGIVFIAAIAEGKRKVKFELKPTKWYTYKRNGDVIEDKAELSKRYAASYFSTLAKLFDHQIYADIRNKNNMAAKDNTATANTNAKPANNTPKEGDLPGVDSSSLTVDDMF